MARALFCMVPLMLSAYMGDTSAAQAPVHVLRGSCQVVRAPNGVLHRNCLSINRQNMDLPVTIPIVEDDPPTAPPAPIGQPPFAGPAPGFPPGGFPMQVQPPPSSICFIPGYGPGCPWVNFVNTPCYCTDPWGNSYNGVAQ